MSSNLTKTKPYKWTTFCDCLSVPQAKHIWFSSVSSYVYVCLQTACLQTKSSRDTDSVEIRRIWDRYIFAIKSIFISLMLYSCFSKILLIRKVCFKICAPLQQVNKIQMYIGTSLNQHQRKRNEIIIILMSRVRHSQSVESKLEVV